MQQPKLANIYKEAEEWSNLMGVDKVLSLNKIIEEKKYCIIMILETSVFIVLMVEKHQKMQRKEQEKVDIMEVL